MKAALLVGLIALASPAAAQQRANLAYGAILRVLDKTTGRTQDLTLRNGQVADMGYLHLRLDECRHPAHNPNGDAFAHVTVSYGEQRDEVFKGWMIASAPAVNAMDHPRFDAWVLRCTTS